MGPSHVLLNMYNSKFASNLHIERVVDRLPLMTYGLKLSLEA